MAVQNVLLRKAAKATEDLSAKQYFFVELTETGEISISGANKRAFVLEDQPKSGQYGTYCISGETKAVTAEEIKAGEAISVNSEGKAVKATATVITSEKVATQGSQIVGIALTKASSGALVSFITASGRA